MIASQFQPLYLGTLRHVRDGLVQRVQAGKTRERYILIFAEALVLLKLLKGGKYQAEAVYDMGELVIKPDGKGGGYHADGIQTQHSTTMKCC